VTTYATTRYLTPHARVRHASARFLRSQFVADVRAGWLRRVLPGLGVLGVAWASIVVLRGLAVAAELSGIVR